MSRCAASAPQIVDRLLRPQPVERLVMWPLSIAPSSTPTPSSRSNERVKFQRESSRKGSTLP
jgi:hypothetical protein